jgi:RNA polymerase sigma factor (sigma-70 family)
VEWVTTSSLLDGLRDFGNRTAWERLAARFRKPIVAFATHLELPAAEADDVAQETLLAFAKAIREGRYDPSKGRLSHWLFGIAYRQAQNARRSRAQRLARAGAPPADSAAVLSDLPDEAAARTTWDREWEQALLEQCLDRARREVEPETFRAFELVVCEGRSPAAAAAELGIAVKKVYNAKHRLLERVRVLRAELEATA